MIHLSYLNAYICIKTSWVSNDVWLYKRTNLFKSGPFAISGTALFKISLPPIKPDMGMISEKNVHIT